MTVYLYAFLIYGGSELLEVNTLVNKNIKKMKFIVDIVFDSLYYIRALMSTAANEIEISVFEN